MRSYSRTVTAETPYIDFDDYENYTVELDFELRTSDDGEGRFYVTLDDGWVRFDDEDDEITIRIDGRSYDWNYDIREDKEYHVGILRTPTLVALSINGNGGYIAYRNSPLRKSEIEIESKDASFYVDDFRIQVNHDLSPYQRTSNRSLDVTQYQTPVDSSDVDDRELDQDEVANTISESDLEITLSMDDSIAVYPNPAVSTVSYMVHNEDATVAHFTLYYLSGKTVQHFKDNVVSGGSVDHDISALPQGTYVYTIQVLNGDQHIHTYTGNLFISR